MTKDNLPNHIVIVPDGNRRWARQRNLASWQGHLKGAERTKEIIQAAADSGIFCLTIWGGSLDNVTKRPEKEIKALFKIYERYFSKLLKSKEIYKNEVKVNVIGRWQEILPQKCKEIIGELIQKTEKHNHQMLNFMIAYSGTDEMLEAIKGIVQEAGRVKNPKVDEGLLRRHLWSGELPEVDFLIRTGSSNDPHNSAGFMMWQTANSQFYFTKEYYPDFDRTKFFKAIKRFTKRQRRLGK